MKGVTFLAIIIFSLSFYSVMEYDNPQFFDYTQPAFYLKILVSIIISVIIVLGINKLIIGRFLK